MSKKIASLYAEIGADVSGLEKGMNKAAASMDSFSKQTKTEAKSWESVQKQKMKAYDEYARELTRQYKAQEKAEKDAARAAKKAAEEQAESFKKAATVTIAAVVAISAALKDSYQAYQEYSNQVRDLATVSGTTAQEASVLLQVLDDYQISAENVTAATKAMTKAGLTPTIDTLAKLSDEYLKINDAQERNAFILKNLGKGGLEWVNVLKQGGDAIRANSQEVNKALILTDEQIKKAERARLAVDTLSDSWEGLKVSVGAYVGEQILLSTTMSDAEKIYKEWASLNGMSVVQLEKTRWGISETTSEYQLFSAEYEKNAALTEFWTKQLQDNSMALEDNVESVKALSDSISGQIGLIKSIQSANEQYTEKSNNLAGQRTEAEAKLADFRRQGYSEQSEQIQGQLGKIEEIKNKESELAKQRMLQSKEFVLGLIEQNLARDGWTENEFNAYVAAREASGTWSHQAVEDAKAAWMEANKITEAINGIPRDVPVNVKFNVSGYSGVANYDERVASAKTQHASGGMFKIPMSYGNEGFKLGNGDTASGGEGLQIVPKDQMNGGGNAGGANIELIAAIRALTRQMSMQGIGV